MSELACSFCWAPGHEALTPRARGAICGVVMHRIEVSQEDPSYADTPAEIARFFREHPLGRTATGGAMPYPVLIAAAGGVTQTVPLCRVTPHARAYNPTTIGIGMVGDFRRRAPPQPQWQAAVAVARELLLALSLPVTALHGHDELADASSDANKECPGRCFSMIDFRSEVARASSAASGRYAFVW